MIKIICVAYERPIAMRGLIDSFLLQTNPNWELMIVYDGPVPGSIWDTIDLYEDDRVLFDSTETRTQNYGHINRRETLENMTGYTEDDFLLMTNDDNYYVPVFVDYFLKEIKEDIGMVYCDSVHSHFEYAHHKTKIAVDHIDIGSFIVRVDVAKAVGFKGVEFNADGYYAENCFDECQRRGLREVYIPKPLFVHN
jgi:hypothetical protein